LPSERVEHRVGGADGDYERIGRPGGSIAGVAMARSGTIIFYFSVKSVTSSYSVTELPEVYGYQSLNRRSAATATCATSDQSITI
jgi:hypothetical protein